MLLTTFRKCIWSNQNLTFYFRSTGYKKFYSSNAKTKLVEVDSKLLELIEKHEKNILYNTIVQEQRNKLGLRFRRRVSISEAVGSQKIVSDELNDIALSLKYVSEEFDVSASYKNEEKPKVREQYRRTHFPFQDNITIEDTVEEDGKDFEENEDVAEDLLRDVCARKEVYKTGNSKDWMMDYENFDDVHSDEYKLYNWRINYGTPDPNERTSNVPCGGCGALLHCQVGNVLKKFVLLIFLFTGHFYSWLHTFRNLQKLQYGWWRTIKRHSLSEMPFFKALQFGLKSLRLLRGLPKNFANHQQKTFNCDINGGSARFSLFYLARNR